MTTINHSPEPFTIQPISHIRCGRPVTVYAIRDRRNCNIAMVGEVDAITDRGEGEANARLFAAAPGMLGALLQIKSVLQIDLPPSQIMEIIRQGVEYAITQATEGKR